MDILFLFKKIIGVLIMPINVIILLMLAALILHRYSPKLSFRCLFVSILLLILSSLPVVSDMMMKPIEDNHEAFTYANKPVEYIVVLGCGHVTDDSLPAVSQLRVCSLQRAIEALRIHQLYPTAHIITSGFGGSDKTPNAELIKQALVELGVNEQLIITEPTPQDTEEEAELISARVTYKPVILITNSDHMPRALAYFEQQGVNAIAAPASRWVKDYYGEKSWQYYLPNSEAFEQTTHVWYESFGRFVQWLKQYL
ncbi:YdcF family protein [Thalassotalea sp. PLHSN55]|uniref:YdcF family protein n=1 Tax=Thalassotalea sp. PLHSN55 TaxID=3435888 RepID=UPI003F878DF9